MIELHYDDSKDLYEGLIIENDDGVQSQVAQVLPKFREKYGKKFAAAPELYEALKVAQGRITTEITHHPEDGNYRRALQNELRQIDKALAKAKEEI